MTAWLPANLPDDPEALEALIARREQQARPLKRGAEARIVWSNEQRKQKTPYALVYLHGFRGSQGEGAPTHRTVARLFGCNLYLSRLYGHGQIKSNKFGDLRPHHLVRSAEEACRIGQQIGKKVILMGTSTGAALSLYLAGSAAFRSAISGLILYSPLIHLYGIHSLLLENRWIRGLLAHIPGRNHQLRRGDPFTPRENHIWYRSYRLNGALALGEMTQELMRPSLFKRVQCPAFIGYYYKDRYQHDRVVSTSAIKRMAAGLGTPPAERVLRNFPGAGSHVICSGILSESVQEVIDESGRFLREKIGLTPVSQP